MRQHTALYSLAVGAALLGLSAAARAQIAFNVDFTSLPANTASIELSLSDGNVASLGAPDTNNSVKIDDFLLGGGSPGAVLPPIGNASGDIGSSVSLKDGDPGGVADFAQAFTPGTTLSFDVHMSTNVDTGGTPDLFLVRLLDSSLTPIATTDAMGNDGFVTVLLGQGGPVASGTLNGLPAPTITLLGASVPEPGTIGLLAGLVVPGLALLRRRCR